MSAFDLLTKPLYSLEINEVRELNRIAHDIFEPLIRNFRQSRTTWDFSYQKTIREAHRTGHLLPAYDRKSVDHRKSRLVIAMSLSGMDRCCAVTLIPLFAELRKYLDFRLFIYTNRLIEAEFTEDGFLRNDIDICWNNVVAPLVFKDLNNISFDKQEETLLLIDNMGGGDSKWYWEWTGAANEIQEEQDKYLIPADVRGGQWVRLRNEMNGNFNMDDLPKSKIPPAWKKVVERNCEERWVTAPALQEYLARWLFHPEFGRKRHSEGCFLRASATEELAKLRNKFREIHLLTPNPCDESEYNTSCILDLNVVDYHHEADTIEGFATTITNIVHGRNTNKLTHPKPTFSQYISEEANEGFVVDDEGDEHDEVMQMKGSCYQDVPNPVIHLPEDRIFKFNKRKRGDDEITVEDIPYNQVDLSDWIQRIGFVVRTPHYKRTGSDYTNLKAASEYLEYVRTHRVVATVLSSNSPSVDVRICEPSGDEQLGYFLGDDLYKPYRTRALRQDAADCLRLFNGSYREYLNKLKLQAFVWCSQGVFNNKKLAIGINPDNEGDYRRVVFHELGHYVEHAIPQIGAFTNEFFIYKVGYDIDRKQLVKVGDGEQAMPVRNGTAPWIVPYAGKWYKRDHHDLPNPTEILSVHLEYFRDAESLVKLIRHDPSVVKFIAFILMGGPLAAFNAIESASRRKALDEIEQRDRKKTGYSYSTRRGRSGGRGRGNGSSYTPVKRNQKFGV